MTEVAFGSGVIVFSFRSLQATSNIQSYTLLLQIIPCHLSKVSSPMTARLITEKLTAIKGHYNVLTYLLLVYRHTSSNDYLLILVETLYHLSSVKRWLLQEKIKK